MATLSKGNRRIYKVLLREAAPAKSKQFESHTSHNSLSSIPLYSHLWTMIVPGNRTGIANNCLSRIKSLEKKKNRCLCCKKKIGLTGFTCRCGNLLCSIHRYSDKHNCTIDYKELGAEEIRKNNPMVIVSKVSKI